MINESVYMTQEGLDKVKEELEYLQTTRREEISEKLEKAIAQGDLKENADYHAAKEEQGFTEGRIKDIEDILRRVQIIKNTGASDVVRVGSKVTVCEVVPHTGDVTPGNFRLACENLRVDLFDRFANLDQADSHGVEDETVVEAATPNVRFDSRCS